MDTWRNAQHRYVKQAVMKTAMDSARSRCDPGRWDVRWRKVRVLATLGKELHDIYVPIRAMVAFISVQYLT